MRNIVISGLVIGVLACPVVFAAEATQEQAVTEQQAAHETAKPAQKHHGKKKHRKRHKKDCYARHQMKKKHQSNSAPLPKETPAEREIKQETDKADATN